MVLDPIPQPLTVHFFGSRPQPPTSPGYASWHVLWMCAGKNCGRPQSGRGHISPRNSGLMLRELHHCGMTVEVVYNMLHNSLIAAQSRTRDTHVIWLVHVWHDSFTMWHVHVTVKGNWIWSMYIASRMSHVTLKGFLIGHMYHEVHAICKWALNGSCHVWTSHEWVTSRWTKLNMAYITWVTCDM